MHIGLQLSSLKPYIQTCESVKNTLKRVRNMGYTDVQLQWIGTDVPCEFIGEKMRANGIACWGTQDYYDAVMARLEYEIYSAKIYSSHYICVSGIPERFMSKDGLNAMAAEMEDTCRRLADHGITLTFHPRRMEYVQFDGIAAACRLLDLAPDVQLTLDAYHSELAGMDTVELIKRYSGRIDMVHLKDSEHRQPGAPLVPLGQGDINFESIIDACPAAGVKIIFAEQESWQQDAFMCMEQSFKYLRSHVSDNQTKYREEI